MKTVFLKQPWLCPGLLKIRIDCQKISKTLRLLAVFTDFFQKWYGLTTFLITPIRRLDALSRLEPLLYLPVYKQIGHMILNETYKASLNIVLRGRVNFGKVDI